MLYLFCREVSTLNERLKILRLSLKLSQEKFGAVIGIQSRAHISSLEIGSRNLTDRIISDICREFNVNEEWLRSGTGKMFIETDSSLTKELVSRYHLDILDTIIIENFLKLSAEERKIVKDFILSTANEYKNNIVSTNFYNNTYVSESIDDLEAEYKKNISKHVLKKDASVSNTTEDGEKEKNYKVD